MFWIVSTYQLVQVMCFGRNRWGLGAGAIVVGHARLSLWYEVVGILLYVVAGETKTESHGECVICLISSGMLGVLPVLDNFVQGLSIRAGVRAGVSVGLGVRIMGWA
jgi:hypothetical protein